MEKAIDVLVHVYNVYVVLFLMKLQPDIFGQIQVLCVLSHVFPINVGPYFNHYQADQIGTSVNQEKLSRL